MPRFPLSFCAAALCLLPLGGVRPATASPPLTPYNVIWETPGPDSRASMPLGNGDIGLNVWVEKSGDLVFYVSKTDAWGDEVHGDYGLPKVGRVRVHLSPNPFPENVPFRQTLRLQEGDITITGGDPAHRVTLHLWVDANRPVIHLDGDSAQTEQMQVSIDTYRTRPDHGLSADVVFPAQSDSVAWCYRNGNRSIPALKNLTFGAVIRGEGMTGISNSTLQSVSSQQQFDVRLYPLTAQTDTAEAWHTLALRSADADRKRKSDEAYRDHRKWWREFWDRSWVVASGNADADTVSRGYVLQRFMTACAGRGAFPIKFNGSLFTTDYTITRKDRTTGLETAQEMTGDYRAWGGQYWFQNTRPMYWPLLQSGDFDLMQPLFRMYAGKLTDSEKLIHDYYGHDGAYFAETAPFWAELPHLKPEDKPWYTNRYFTPILELSAMMLDYYAYTGDRNFARKTLLPVADSGITFFEKHFGRDANGKLDLVDDNAIETYWKVHNPAPDIAGLRYVLPRLLQLPESLTTAAQRDHWRAVFALLPDLPHGEENHKPVLLPFQSADDPARKNGENPELYAIYPFRLYGLGKPGLMLARDTFAVRKARGTTCWLQDPVQAAYLGDAALARRDVLQNFSDKSRDPKERFPAFWGPFHDYTPDEDNGGNGMHALQLMLLQSDDDKILLLPAWPDDWNATFKLHAPHNTVVEGTVQAGKITALTVTPRSRRRDLYRVQLDGTLVPFSEKTEKAITTKETPMFPGATFDFHGFVGHTFPIDGCAARVVAPRTPLPGAPWIWRTMFWDAFPKADIALLERGFHVAFIDVGNTFGCPDAMKHFDAFYREMTGTYKLAPRPALEGLSRGGLYAYRWAYVNTDKIACVYGDAPVCDMKSWPGGKGKGTGSPRDWQEAIHAYHFANEEQMLAFTGNPIDILAPLAAAHIPLLHVYGDADTDLPPAENTEIVRERYTRLGGEITVIAKTGCAHHPHGLSDPTPIVNFIVAHATSGPAAEEARRLAPRAGTVTVLPPGSW